MLSVFGGSTTVENNPTVDSVPTVTKDITSAIVIINGFVLAQSL